MGHFSTPLHIKALPEEGAVRISVRASEYRVDEWTILKADAIDVLMAEEDYQGWRGKGELRVRVGPSGGDVAFYDGDDRALLRLGSGEIASFLAHLSAAINELPNDTPRPRGRPAFSYQGPDIASTQVSRSAPGAEVEALRGMMQQIMLSVVTLASDVNKLMTRLAEREAERAAAPPPAPAAPPIVQIIQPQAPAAVITRPAHEDEEPSIFIPDRVGTELTGDGLTSQTASSDGDDIAVAAAALKAAKKRRTKKKED